MKEVGIIKVKMEVVGLDEALEKAKELDELISKLKCRCEIDGVEHIEMLHLGESVLTREETIRRALKEAGNLMVKNAKTLSRE